MMPIFAHSGFPKTAPRIEKRLPLADRSEPHAFVLFFHKTMGVFGHLCYRSIPEERPAGAHPFVPTPVGG